MTHRETSIKLNIRSVRAKGRRISIDIYVDFIYYLPRAINVQLLKFFEIDLFDNMTMVIKFPQIPIVEIIMLYGKNIFLNMPSSSFNDVFCSA